MPRTRFARHQPPDLSHRVEHRGLGQSLHVTITAVGVETEGQAEILRKWGCNQGHGFYYGRPEADVPESEETLAKRPQVA